MTPSPQNPPLFGITNPSLLQSAARPAAPIVAFGLYTMLYGSPAKPLASRYDDAGNLTGFVPLRPLRECQFLPMPAGNSAPDFGAPYEQGLVVDPKKPDDIVVGSWSQIATILTGRKYPAVRRAALHHPLEGYYVAKFISHDAPGFARSGGKGFAVAAARTKIRQMAAVRKTHFTQNPQWLRTQGISWPARPRVAPPARKK